MSLNTDVPDRAGTRVLGWALLVLVVVGLGLRVAVALGLGISAAPVPGSDPSEYDTYAWNLAQGRGYRGMSPDVKDRDHLTAYRPPGTSVIWAGCYKVFGHRYAVIRLLNCVMGAACIMLVYGITRRCFGELAGVIAAAMYGVWPLAVFYCSQLMSEVPGTLMFLAFLWFCLKLGERATWGSAIGAGVMLGLTILTRPNPLLMIPLTGVWALWQFRKSRAGLVRGLAVPVIALVTMVPWWVRNYEVFHKFIPLSTMGGSSLLQGNNRIVATDPNYYGYSIWDTKIPEYHNAIHATNDEVKRDAVAKRLAMEWIKANMGKLPRMVVNKVIRAWTPFLQARSPRIYRWGTLVSWGPTLVLFLIGLVPSLVMFLRRRHPGWILHLTILGSVVLTMILFGETRYRFTEEPVCIAIAAWVLAGVVGRVWPGLARVNVVAGAGADVAGDIAPTATAGRA